MIKQQYWSWLGIRSTTLSINLLELSPMQLNVGMGLGFSHHHFSQSLKVHSWMPNDMSNRIWFIELKHLASIARPLNFEVFLPAISYMFSGIIWATQARHDNTRAHTLPRWTLEMGNLWIGALHCWLPWASVAYGNHPRLVQQVSAPSLLIWAVLSDFNLQMWCSFR